MRTAFAILVLLGLIVGAFLLYPTAVPDDLALPAVDVPGVFGGQVEADGERYEEFLYVVWILEQLTLFAVLFVYSRRGVAFMRESSAGPIGTGMFLGMIGLGIVWLVRLPFRLARHWWERRHDVSDLDYLSWLAQDWQLLALYFAAICFALLVVMALATWLGELWWLPGAAVFTGIVALLLFVSPYLDFGTTKKLVYPTLQKAAREYEQKLGLPDIPLRVEEVSTDTEQANAYAYGIGPSRRVVFWDTILQEPFRESEQKVVLAHELAHHSNEHLPKGIAWFAIFAVPGALILMLVTRRRGGMGRAEAVPLALFVVAVMQLVAAPAQNWISRRMEAEADWKALQVTHDPASLERLMVHFAQTSLGDPAPPSWVEAFLGTHPTLADRVAMAKAWRERTGAGPAGG
jgi:Zn-dependent protease with chaperone function